MKKHRMLWGLLAAAAGFALLLGGVATASNMGFKFVPQIPGTANANALNLSLPWNNNYTDAKSLFDDLNGQTPGISKVTRFNTNATLSSWIGGGVGGTRFPVVKGSSYIVFGSGAGQTPVVVGSHDPAFTFTFAAGQAYNAAAPYHQTLTDAKSLWDSLNTACPGNINKVTKFNSNATLSSWIGGGVGGTRFNLDLGMGVIVFAKGSGCSGYVWPHY